MTTECWRWIGHTLHKPCALCQYFTASLNLEAIWKKKREGRPRNTWQGDLEADIEETGAAIEDSQRD